jgi:HPt (histidine-containing phosphotransfer) domain-containing protein
VTQNLSDYFASEAGEYLEQMERALGGDSPDASRLARLARGVRGSAQVAGASAIAAVAERVEWKLRAAADSGAMDAGLAGRVLEGVRGLRVLVESHGSWGREEEARARELAAAWDDAQPPRRDSSTSGDGLAPFVARELIGVVAALDRAGEALSADPAELAPLREVLRSTRALRGVTGARPLAPVLEVLEALEGFTAAQAGRGSGVGVEGKELIRAAREALAAAGRRAAGGGMPSPDDEEQQRFRELRLQVLGSDAAGDPRDAVPVEELFSGSGVQVVSSPVAPATESDGETSFASYVRGESERHLERALVALPPGGGVDAARPALLDAALAVRALAATYGLAPLMAAAGEAAARLQLSPSVDDARGALDALRARLPEGEGAWDAEETAPAPRPAAADAASGDGSGDEGEAVPMEDLLLRGDRALEAALALRERALAAASGEEARELLAELFDLLDLARTQESVV